MAATNTQGKTFIISGSGGLDTNELRKILISMGMIEIVKIDKNIKYIDYIFVEQILVNNVYKYLVPYTIKCFMKNLLTNYNSIYDKDLLYDNMEKYAKTIATKHMAYSVNIKDFILLLKTNVNKVKKLFGDIIIIKPVGTAANSGKGIQVIEIDYKNINNLITEVENADKSLKRFNNVIVCKYINNPLLFTHGITKKMVKMHLRVFLLIKIVDGKISYSRCKKAYIIHAYDEYKKSDYANPRIHDTHAKSTVCYPIYPDDFKQPNTAINSIDKQMDLICKKLKIIVEKEGIEKYSESENGYTVFGLDVLIQDNYNVILLEVNAKLGHARADGGCVTGFSAYYYKWLTDNIIC